MESKGFVLVHRKLRDSWQWREPTWVKAWLWILCEASFDPEHAGEFVLPPLSRCATLWGMSKTGTKRFMDRLLAHGEVERKWNAGGTQVERYAVSNYMKYQRPDIGKLLEGGTQVERRWNDSGTISPNSSSKEEQINKYSRSTEVERPVKRRQVSEKKAKDPRIKELIDLYHDLHVELRGHKPLISGAKEVTILRKMLSILEMEEIKRRLRAFLEDGNIPKRWSNYGIYVFSQVFEQYDDRPTNDVPLFTGHGKAD